LTTTGVQATAFISSSRAKRLGEEKWPDLQWVMLGTSVYNNYGKDSEHSFNVKPGLLQKFYEYGKGTDSFQIINILNRPLTRGEVRLKSSNPTDPPLMDPKYLENYEDVKSLIESKDSVKLFYTTFDFIEMQSMFVILYMFLRSKIKRPIGRKYYSISTNWSQTYAP
jgi:choline dehydrogenase-like flavoprotein